MTSTRSLIRFSIAPARRWLFTCLFLFVPAFVSAQTQAPDVPKASDVRIVIDISGSMKKNDPQNLRRPALEMLVKLLPDGSQAGVWTFGQYVNMLVKHRPVDEGWRQEALTKAQEINSIAQFTNIGQSLEKAAYDKDYSTRGAYQTHVILLTDGMVDIDRNPEVNVKERNRILESVLPDYQSADYHIHTISLSDNADKNLMDRLALGTNGQSVIAKNADELMSVFLQVFDQAVPKEELPFDGNSFLTDSSIEEFTALIFPQPGSAPVELMAPDQQLITQDTVDPTVNWFHTDQYDLITVKQPLEGEWRVKADLQPQSRITVVSDLSLVVKPLPVNLLMNQEIDLSLALREENKVVNRAEFLQLIDIDATVNHLGDEQQWQMRLSDGLVPGNGVYQTTLNYFSAPGDYEVKVNVDGKSFQRQFSHRLTVREPFTIETKTLNQNGKTVYQVLVNPQDTKIDLDQTQVVGKLKTPEGTSTIQTFTFNDRQQWELKINPESEGTYYLTLRISAVNDKGVTTDVIPESITFQYPETDDLFAEPQSEPKPAPAPVVAEPKEEKVEPAPKPKEEPEVVEEEEIDLSGADDEESDMTQWILYGVLAVVNVLIILVIYFLYRKLFGAKKEDVEDEGDAADAADAPPPAPESFDELQMDTLEEPPMNEMAIDELDTDLEDDLEAALEEKQVSQEMDIDTALEEDIESALDEDIDLAADDPFDVENDPLADLGPEALDDMDIPTESSDDEEPEFSLDDFAPDFLDDDEDETKGDKKE